MDNSGSAFLVARDQLRWRVAVGLVAVITAVMLGLGPMNASLDLPVASQLAWVVGICGAMLLILLWRLPKAIGVRVAFGTFALLSVAAMAYGAWRGHSIHHWGYLFPPLIVFLLRPRIAAFAMAGFGLYTLLISAHLLDSLDIVRFVSIYTLLAGFITTFALLEEEAGLPGPRVRRRAAVAASAGGLAGCGGDHGSTRQGGGLECQRGAHLRLARQ
jgi:hypothetical protein